MLNENARKWVAALRSGEYKQGQNALRNGDTFCCLGVACDISKDELGLEWENPDGPQWLIDSSSECLPTSVQSWLGLCDHNGYGWFDHSSGARKSLAGLNDDEGATFDEIADCIESEPPGLFIPTKEV